MLLNSLFKHWSYRFFAPGMMVRQTYEAFKRLLLYDGQCHELMAELEVLYHDGRREDFALIKRRYEKFAVAVSGMIENFTVLEPTAAAALLEYYKKFNFYICYLLAPPEQLNIPPYVVNLASTPDVELAGHKAHNLALLDNKLHLPVPLGFVITTKSFFALLEHNNLRPALDNLLAEIDLTDSPALVQLSESLVSLIKSAEIPPKVSHEILTNYEMMAEHYGGAMLTAVRSSAISEDSEYSFAGQYKTIIAANRETILVSYLDVAASKYSPEALFYRINLGLMDEETPIAVLVMAMVEAAASGVVYTTDPVEKGDDDMLVIRAVRGLGETLVSGAATPDTFFIERRKLEVVRKVRGRQREGVFLRHNKPVTLSLSKEEKNALTLVNSEARQLASWGMAIEDLFGLPQDVEWARDRAGKLFLLQARPLGRESVQDSEYEACASDITPEPLLSGGQRAAGGTAAGVVYQAGTGNLDDIPSGVVLVTRFTPPAIVRVMNRLTAVVADEGSIAGHFATVCREFGVPLLVDTQEATSILTHGQVVTVDADQRRVYPGRVESLLRGDKPAKNVKDLPYFKKLRAVLDFITPLKLIDPKSTDFLPRSCRSMHDIIRYSHEKAVQAMFSLGSRISGSSGRSRELQTSLPVEVYLLDVGGGIDDAGGRSVLPEQVRSIPFRAVWRGISHPGVDWHSHSHFDWKNFDDIALAGGMAIKSSGDYASYAVIGRDYLNLNIRFGYHFTLVDVLCGLDIRANYCQFRFAGGGGEYSGRSLRIEFISIILRRLGFEVDARADLLDARISIIECKELEGKLEALGALLGSTKLMDMILKEGMDVRPYVERFFAGEYNFSSLRVKDVGEQ